MGSQGKHVVIVGAGQSGAASAQQLRVSGFDGAITLIGEEAHLPYERPQLSKELLLQDDFKLKSINDSDEFQQLGIDLFLGKKVTMVDATQKLVVLNDGESIGYDFLIIAAGVRPRKIPNIQGDNVFYLRTYEDAQQIKSSISGKQSLAIVGGGVIGLEVAAAANIKGCDVTVIEASEKLMARSLTEETSKYLENLHSENGINIKLGVFVEDVREDGKLLLSDKSEVVADKILVGVGVTPNTEPFSDLGITDEFGIKVDEYGKTEIPEIFATGDIASQPAGKTYKRIETWANAQNHAVCVAKNIMGEKNSCSTINWFWSDQGSINLQVIGTSDAPIKVVRVSEGSNKFSEFFLDEESTLLGCISFNNPKDIGFARKWMQKGARIDPALLADGSVKLKSCELQ
ncbi:pyridine nucleotide-disulfide oxidoreductase [Marinobacter sp. NP-6]|uniref:NAD(P)/FAD-dependent oxidoreductase n=1 Tax=Marinobacter sp. NP-6 TaxID=2488666 RepID=UPI000FCAA9FE|nr:FAD-dependent oxidoreductase [Marinobacter sp. NP-6]RUT76981.1 pyridine nucleotide-disulfide oxidoreductase [Marinobacter sp. NP-6]